MTHRNGFTLIEALITTVILVTGLTAVAGAFSYSSVVTSRVLQETVALALITDKMEDLKLPQEVASGRYSEDLVVGAATYLRTWEITSDTPARITVIVYGRAPGRPDSFRELARVSTLVGSRF